MIHLFYIRCNIYFPFGYISLYWSTCASLCIDSVSGVSNLLHLFIAKVH